MIMKKIALILINLVFIINFGSAQIKAVTEKGDTISVYENGTWEKFISNKAVTYIESNVKATVEVDEFEKTKKITTETWKSFGKNTLNKTIYGSLFRLDDLTVFTILYTGDLGCLSQHSSTMKVKLTNGQIIEFSQISDTKCGDFTSAKFIPLTREQLKIADYKTLLNENLEILKQFDWETIRIHGSEYYTDITPNPSKKMLHPEQFFRQHIISADNN